MSLTALERSLREDGVLPFYVLVGDAAPLREEAVDLLLSRILPTIGPPAFNHGSFRLSQDDPSAPLSAARTLPMLSDRRLVVVRDLHDAPDAFFEGLVALVGQGASHCVMVCVGDRFPKVVKGGSNWLARVRKALEGRGLLLSFDAKDASPARYATEQAARLGKQLGRREAELLVELTGPDLGRVRQEVEKLVLYVGDAPAIGADDVHAACSLLAEAVIWDLTAGMAAQDAEQALGALHRLSEAGDDPRRLLSMIVWQARELLKMAELVRSGASDADVRAAVRMRPEVYRRVRARVGRGFPGAADLLRRLATAHRDMNGHRAGDRRVLEGLVLEMLR